MDELEHALAVVLEGGQPPQQHAGVAGQNHQPSDVPFHLVLDEHALCREQALPPVAEPCVVVARVHQELHVESLQEEVLRGRGPEGWRLGHHLMQEAVRQRVVIRVAASVGGALS